MTTAVVTGATLLMGSNTDCRAGMAMLVAAAMPLSMPMTRCRRRELRSSICAGTADNASASSASKPMACASSRACMQSLSDGVWVL